MELLEVTNTMRLGRPSHVVTTLLVLLAAVPLAGAGCASGEPAAPGAPSASSDADAGAAMAAPYAPESVKHSFRSKLGDDIDCVDFAAEPGVRALLARGASVEDLRRGLASVAARSSPPTSAAASEAHFDGSLDAQGAARACPDGTVAHVRLDRERLAAMQRVGSERHAPPSFAPPMVPADGGLLTEYVTPGQQYAWVYATYNDGTKTGFTAQGGTTTTTIAGPAVPWVSGDHSVSQVWAWSWGPGTTPTQTVEAGWWVNAGSSTPTLFVSGTADSYADWCISGWNCGAWVPNPGATLALNAALPASVPGGVQHELTITVKHQRCSDVPTGCTGTWLGWGVWAGVDGAPLTYLGYYVNSWYASYLGSGMAAAAMDFKVGGEVYDYTGNLTVPQNVPMGEGPITLGAAAYGQTAYHRDFGYYDGMSFVEAGATAYYTSPYYVYSLTSPPGAATWSDYFYFGSLGCASTCAAAGAQCGTASNGCGGTLSCGSCKVGTCSSNHCCPKYTTWDGTECVLTSCPPGYGDCGGYCCKCSGTTCY